MAYASASRSLDPFFLGTLAPAFPYLAKHTLFVAFRSPCVIRAAGRWAGGTMGRLKPAPTYEETASSRQLPSRITRHDSMSNVTLPIVRRV